MSPFINMLSTILFFSFYLNDVLNIKPDIKLQFNVMLGQDHLLCLTVVTQATEGSSVAGPLLISAKNHKHKSEITVMVTYVIMFTSVYWTKSTIYPPYGSEAVNHTILRKELLPFDGGRRALINSKSALCERSMKNYLLWLRKGNNTSKNSCCTLWSQWLCGCWLL